MFNNEFPYGYGEYGDHSRRPYYNDESDYNTNSPSYYDDLARKQQLIKYLAMKIGVYDKELEKRFKEWDKNLEKFPENVERLLREWMDDGTFKRIINEEIFSDLNDLINNNFKDLSNRKIEYNYQHSRKIEHVLPLKFPHWQQFANDNKGARLYPQSFTMDWVGKEIFIYYSPTSTVNTTDRVVAVFDMTTKEYKTSFIAGNAGGEAIAIRRFNGNRYLYVKTENHKLGRFLLNDLPQPLQKLTPQEEYIVNNEWQFATDDKNWVFVDAGTDYGVEYRKTSLTVTDLSFNLIGGISLDKSSSGLFNSKYETLFTKRQGIALGNSKIYLGLGGFTKKGVNSHYGDYGVRVLNMKGEIETDGVTNAQDMIDVLTSKGFNVQIIENEGVHVSDVGKVYSLCITSGLDTINAEKEGIIIFEEFSGHEDAINFSKNSSFYPMIPHNTINSSMYPRIKDGKYINMLTGEEFKTIPQVIDYMFDTSITQIKLYAGVQDITSLYFPDGINKDYLITITNINNVSAIIEYSGSPAIADVKTKYYKKDGIYVENVIFDNRWFEVKLADGIDSIYPGEKPRVIVSNHVKTLHGHVKGIGDVTQFPHKLGTLPSEVRPLFNRTMIAPMSTSGVGGYAVFSLQASGDILLHYKEKNMTTISFNGNSYY